MLLLCVTLLPLTLLIGIYLSNKWWLMDFNTTTAIRSFLFGPSSNKSLFEPESIGCFPHSDPMKSTSSSARKTSSPPDVSKLKVTSVDSLSPDNFTFTETDKCSEDSPRALVIIFAWLFAKERHLDKYRLLYLDKGFDVLTVKVNVKDFLLPQAGTQQIAANIVRFVLERQHKLRALLFHAFSVGAYQLGEIFVLLKKECNKQAGATIRNLLKGLIYDSALDINEAPVGLSKATTNNVILQWAIVALMNAHLKLCYHLSTRHYISSSQAVHENPFRCPTLVFLSKDDEVVDYKNQFEAIEQWRQEGIQVVAKCWEESPHVSHFFKHRDEYQSTMMDFLRDLAQVL